MLTFITLGLVVLKYVLDYAAPRTKTKVDDKARDVVNVLPLPTLGQAAKDAAEKLEGKPRAAATVTIQGTKPAPAPRPVEGFKVRDHR